VRGRLRKALLRTAPSAASQVARQQEALIAKKMCKMFNKVQGGLQVTSTFDSQGIVEALPARVEASKTTATVAEPQESGDTASEAGVSITTSSMKTLLAFQRLLISTTFFFFFFFFFNGSAENSQKKSP